MDILPEQIAHLVRDGRKIEAVKAIREETGVSLKEALRAVETLEAMAEPEASGALLAEARALVSEGRSAEAVQRLRKSAGLSQKEARDVVDALPSPPQANRSRAVATVAVVLAAVIAVIIALLGFLLAA